MILRLKKWASSFFSSVSYNEKYDAIPVLEIKKKIKKRRMKVIEREDIKEA